MKLLKKSLLQFRKSSSNLKNSQFKNNKNPNDDELKYNLIYYITSQ